MVAYFHDSFEDTNVDIILHKLGQISKILTREKCDVRLFWNGERVVICKIVSRLTLLTISYGKVLAVYICFFYL